MMNSNNLPASFVRSDFFLSLYKKAFPSVARYIARMGGSFEEAQDIFQDALIICFEKKIQMTSGEIVDEKAYLLGISKNLWLQHFKKGGRYEPIDDYEGASESCEQLSSAKILRFLTTAGRKCMDLLKSYYYEKLSAHEIAERFGYSGEHSATVGKYKCLEKVRETVKQKSLAYADFIE